MCHCGHRLAVTTEHDAFYSFIETDEHILTVAMGGTVSGILLMATDIPEANGRSLADTGLPIVSLHFDLSRRNVPSVISNDY